MRLLSTKVLPNLGILAFRSVILCCMKVCLVLKMFNNIIGLQSINVRSIPTQDTITINMSDIIKCLLSVYGREGDHVPYVQWDPLRFDLATLNKYPQRGHEAWYPKQRGKEKLWLLWEVVGPLGGGIWLDEPKLLMRREQLSPTSSWTPNSSWLMSYNLPLLPTHSHLYTCKPNHHQIFPGRCLLTREPE